MNVLFLSPNFPAYNRIFAEQLMLRGVNVLGVGDAVYDYFSDAQKAALTEYYRVENLEDYDSVYRAAAYYTHKYGRLDRIVSMNGYWQPLEAALRTDYAMEGNQSATRPQMADFDVTYEALVDGSGMPVLSMSRVVSGSDGSYTRAKIDIGVRTVGEKNIATLGVRNGFITVEMKKTATGYRVVNSFAAPAPFVPDVINYAFDFDVYSAWANLLTGGVQEKSEQKHSVAMILAVDGKEYPGVSAEYFAGLENKLVQESSASEAMVGVGGDTIYIVREENEDNARSVLSVFAGKKLKAFGETVKKPDTSNTTARKVATPRKSKVKAEEAKAVKIAVIDETTSLPDKTDAGHKKAEAKPESASKLLDASVVPEKKKRGRKPSAEKQAMSKENKVNAAGLK